MSKRPTSYDVFTDASVCSNRNAAGLGWVFTKGGRYVKAGAKHIEGKEAKKTTLCEILAVSEVLQIIDENSVVKLHCDDRDLVNLINDPAALQKRIEKSKPRLMEAYTDLQNGIARHSEVAAHKSSPEISPLFFHEAHDLAKMGAELTNEDTDLYKKQFKRERDQKVFNISLRA